MKNYTITTAEKILLTCLEDAYQKGYAARDENGDLCIFTEKPEKSGSLWQAQSGNVIEFYMFNHMFSMIRWEDHKAWKIADLLRLKSSDRK